MSAQAPFLSVLVPALNEERTLEAVIEAVLAVPEDLEIILVDDGSSDATWDIMSRHVDGRTVRAFRHDSTQGKGAAVRTALAQARGEYVIIQDADLEYDPSQYSALLAPLRTRQATVVYGSRAFASHTAFSYWYVVGNRAVALAANLIYNCYLSDVETCYKLMPRSVALRLDLRARGFELEPEITAKLLRLGHRIYEVPISYTARTREEGKKLTARDGVRAITTLARYRGWRPRL